MTDSMKDPAGDWARELHQQTMTMGYKLKARLFCDRSRFQRVEVVESEGFGRMLFNDGVVMLSERDEFVYHEMIAHVPLFVHPGAARVLVVGGGDGGTVREVLRHPTVRHCRLVEIDGMVVDACARYITQTSSALSDDRVQVTIGDGVEFVATTDQRYDLVLVDSTDPVGPAKPLFGAEFYGNVARVLREDGIVVSQAESPFFNAEQQRSMLEILSRSFRRAHIYNYANITYPGGLWSFTFACRGDLCPLGDFEEERVTSSGIDFRYYSAPVHRAAFVLPAFQRHYLDDCLTPFEAEN